MADERYIYGLFDPTTGEIKYIGQTNNIKVRFMYHKNTVSFDSSKKGQWLSSLRKLNLAPEIEILETTQASKANEAERFWIEYFRMLGSILTNRRHFQACNYSPKINIPQKWRNKETVK